MRLEEQRTKLERSARRLLKDCGFLLDRWKDICIAQMSRPLKLRITSIKEMEPWVQLVDEQERVCRKKEMTSGSRLEIVQKLHLELLRCLFKLIDAKQPTEESEDHDDGDGQLDREEVRKLARAMGVKMSDVEVDNAMAAMDRDGSGTVDLEEFTRWWKSAAREEAGLKAMSPDDQEDQKAAFSMEIVRLESPLPMLPLLK